MNSEDLLQKIADEMIASKRAIHLRRAGKIVRAVSAVIAYIGMILFAGLLLWLLFFGMAPMSAFVCVILPPLIGGVGVFVGDYMAFESYESYRTKKDRSLSE